MESVRIGNPIEDTIVRAVEPGQFEGEIPDSWRIGFTHGGSAMMAAMQAARLAVADSERSLLSASAVFSKALPPGSFRVRTEVLRESRDVSFVSASLVPMDQPETALTLHAVFGVGGNEKSLASTREFPADVQDPETAQGLPYPTSGPYGEIMQSIPFLQQQERRLGYGVPPDSPSFAARVPRVAVWTRFKKTPLDPSGWLDPLAYPCLSDDNFAYLQTAGPDGLAAVMITLQLDIQWFGRTRSDWVLMHGRIGHASSDYLLSEVELWDPERTLLAVATQRALLKGS